MIRLGVAPIALALSLLSAPAAAGAKGLDGIFAEWSGGDRPGCAVTVTRNGRVTAVRAYGQAIVETGKPNSAVTEFHVASVSKQFTAMAIRLLEAEGRLTLQDDVRSHVPELHDFGSTITLAQLLNHTSGLRDQWELLTMQGRRHGDAFSQEDVLRVLFAQRELNFSPGLRHSYSNSNYTLLATVVERVSGQPFAEFMSKRIFGPLGMTGSYINADVRTIRPNQALPYALGPSGYERRNLAYSNYGATDLRTTPADIGRWLIHLDERVSSKDPFMQVLGSSTDVTGLETSYAWGLMRGEHRGEPILEHSGIDPGFAAQLIVIPQRRLGVAVMCNTETGRVQEIARQVVDLHLGPVSAAPAAPINAPALDEMQLSAFAGLYLDEDGLPFSIELRDGNLFAQGQEEIRPVASNLFELVNAPVSLKFDEGVLTIREPGQQRRARRYDRVAAPLLGGDELKDYAGDYYSDELGVVMRLEVVGDELRFRSPGLDAPLFQPPDALRIRDMFFSPSPMGWIRFNRTPAGAIESLTVTNGRVVNLRFSRLQ